MFPCLDQLAWLGFVVVQVEIIAIYEKYEWFCDCGGDIFLSEIIKCDGQKCDTILGLNQKIIWVSVKYNLCVYLYLYLSSINVYICMRDGHMKKSKMKTHWRKDELWYFLSEQEYIRVVSLVANINRMS